MRHGLTHARAVTRKTDAYKYKKMRGFYLEALDARLQTRFHISQSNCPKIAEILQNSGLLRTNT